MGNGRPVLTVDDVENTVDSLWRGRDVIAEKLPDRESG